ncbi:retrotransposon protein, putative, ty1-copia subclass, partial [Tanacetum coccineum]
PLKDAAPALYAIRAGRVQKNQKKKPYKAAKRNQGKGKAKMGYAPMPVPPFAPKPKNPPTPKKDNHVKDTICHQCGEGHWRRNCPIYLVELLKKKKLSQGASTSGIFTIELYSFPSTSWVYDTDCGTHICITTQGLRGSRKLKPGALSLYVGDGHHAAVEAIGEFYLCLPSGLVLILHNCNYAPSITRGIISISRLYKDGFVNRFENDNTISVSRNNLVYFYAIPRDAIYEIDLSSYNTNDSSMYAISNKRAKLNLDSTLLWHCHLGHISKKRIEKLQHDGLLNSTDIKSIEKCVSCMSGKMARKPYSRQVERVICTDKAKILRKRLKPGKHEHGNRRARKKPGGSYQSQKVKPQSDTKQELRVSCYIDIGYLTDADDLKSQDIHERITRTRHLLSIPLEQCTSKQKRTSLTAETTLSHFQLFPTLENSLITQEASRSLEDLEIIQEEDTHPSIDTSLHHDEDEQEINEPQSDLDAMNVEMQSMKDNQVWDLVGLHPNGKTIGSKWLFKKKTYMDSKVHTYKARIVAKGFTQTYGVDYEETFSPVADIRAIRILIAISAFYDYEIW